MIQFNLLPDVKVQYIKTQRMKRAVIVLALGVIAFSVGLLIILFSFATVQKQHLGNLDEDIKSLRAELENTPELTRILSIQNQLNTLPELYNGRPAVERLSGYLDQTVPTTLDLTDVKIDFVLFTMKISGKAPTLENVNSYADTLKYTTYKSTNIPNGATAFKDVVLKDFSRGEKEATFDLELVFDPVIFDGTQEVSLTVPQLVTTRAQAPGKALFNGEINQEGE